MDKEQEILQKLEQLRVEQLKALKELKKVEKAKKKQRRRTAHGCPVFTKNEGNQNSTTTDKNARTPAEDNGHVMGTSSKSCSRIDGARTKAKFTPSLKREQESEIKEIASAISSSNKDKSSSIKNAAQVNKTEVNNMEVIEVEFNKTEGVTQKEVLATRRIGLSNENSFNANEVVSKPTTSLDLTPKTSLFANEKPENYKKETIIQKEVSATRSNGLPKHNSTSSSKIVSKPGISLDLTPKTSLFAEKKAENTPARVPEQTNVGRLTKSLKFSRKARSSLKFPPASTSWRKSEIPNTHSVSGKRQSLGKIKQIENIAETALGENSVHYGNSCEAKDSENNTNTRHAECKLQDSGPKRTSTNTSRSQANDTKVESGEQEPSKPCSKPLEDRNEKLLSTQSTVSTHCQQFDNFSQNIFSQSLFDDVLEDQSAKDDLSDICETSTTKSDNNQTNTCKTGIEIATVNNKRGQIYNGKDEKQNCSLKTNEKMECAETNLITSSNLKRSACNSSGRRFTSNAIQLEEGKEIGKATDHHLCCKTDTSDISPSTFEGDDLISLKENDEKRTTNSNIPTGADEIRELSSNLPSNSLPQVLNIEDEAEDGKLSTNVIEDAPIQQGENEMISISSSRKITSAKVAQTETGNNQVSDLDDCKSRFLLEETDRQLERQENTSSQSINDNMAAEYNKVSEHEDALLKHQTERLQPEFVEDMLTDFPQIDDIFANELGVFDTRSQSKTQSVESEDRKQTNTVSQEFKNLQFLKDKNSSNFDELLLSQPSSPFLQNSPFEGHSGQGVIPIEREICLQHSLNSPGSCNEVRQIKFLTHQAGKTKLDMIAVCLSRLLVLWRAKNSCLSWVVMHKWILGKDEEIIDVEVASVGSCIVLITGGNFHKALGRVYCVHDKSDCKFDIYDEVSFSDLGETVYGYQDMCLLPNKESIENVSIILASAFGGKIVLTKWTIDLICFCLEDCKDLPEVIGSEMSSLCLVQGSKCLLLGCVDSHVYLWNYNSCELLCRMTLQICLLIKPVFLSAETNSGMIFLSLLYKEENKVDLVAINPQTSRESCLKTFNMVHMIDDKRNKLLHCSKTGAYVISSFQHGQILLWNIATDSKTVLDPKFGDVHCISLHPEDSVIAFGTVSGCVYLNVL